MKETGVNDSVAADTTEWTDNTLAPLPSHTERVLRADGDLWKSISNQSLGMTLIIHLELIWLTSSVQK